MHKIATKFYAAFCMVANYSDPYNAIWVVTLDGAFDFFILAIVAIIFGFGGEVNGFMEIAKFLLQYS